MRPTGQISVVVFFLVTSLCGTVRAQSLPLAAASPWEGEVTGMNVYVRSGAGTSHYPTTKLNAGDRVLVLDEKFGWYRIVPPAKSFSYIDRALVERIVGTDLATVKQDRVFVRAGSHLVSRKSTTQVVLNQGVRVQIIGEADGFYKIKPPHSAAVFISKQYIRNVARPLWTGLLERYMAQPQAIGLAAPPNETAAGWLMIYHSVRSTVGGAVYRVGLSLLDLKDPSRCLLRSDEWVLGPEAGYERSGDVGNVVFPCGACIGDDGDTLRLYYGAADTSVGLVTGSLAKLLDWLHTHGSKPDVGR